MLTLRQCLGQRICYVSLRVDLAYRYLLSLNIIPDHVRLPEYVSRLVLKGSHDGIVWSKGHSDLGDKDSGIGVPIP